jgi:uncharacterized protein (TIGR03067 family)
LVHSALYSNATSAYPQSRIAPQKSDFREATILALLQNWPMNLVAVFFLILLVGCAGFGSQLTSKSDLIGEWVCTSATVDGTALAADTVKLLRLTLTNARYTTTKGSETLFDSTYRIDQIESPARIFMLGNEGDATGKEAHGIFELSGDTLRICYTMPGETAATSFESTVGSKAYLINWRRAPKQ